MEVEVEYNDLDDDVRLLVNDQDVAIVFDLGEESLCDLEGSPFSGLVTLDTFRSMILLSCFCNNDLECNNLETPDTCPVDCIEGS